MAACCEPLSGAGIPSNARPPAPNGQPYYVDTTNGNFYWWNGTAWLKVAPDTVGIDYELLSRRIRLDSGSFTTLPVASGTDFGLVKVGAGLTVLADGTLTAAGPDGTLVAFAVTGPNLQVTVNGVSASVPLSALGLGDSGVTSADITAIFTGVPCAELTAALARCGTTAAIVAAVVASGLVVLPPAAGSVAGNYFLIVNANGTYSWQLQPSVATASGIRLGLGPYCPPAGTGGVAVGGVETVGPKTYSIVTSDTGAVTATGTTSIVFTVGSVNFYGLTLTDVASTGALRLLRDDSNGSYISASLPAANCSPTATSA